MKDYKNTLIKEMRLLNITKAQKCVLKYLIYKSDLTGKCSSIEVNHIAEAVEGGESSTRKTLHALASLELIKINERCDRYNKQLPNDYVILFDPANHSHDYLIKKQKPKKMRDLLDDKTQKSMILNFLIESAKGKGVCSPSIGQISDILGIKKSKVQSIIKSLEEKDQVIKRVSRIAKNGIPMPNIYIILEENQGTAEETVDMIIADASTYNDNLSNGESMSTNHNSCVNLSFMERRVLAYLNGIKKIGNKVIPSVRRISEICKLKMSYVRQTINSLIGKGLIERISRFNTKGSRTSNEYVIKADHKSLNKLGSTINPIIVEHSKSLLYANLSMRFDSFLSAFNETTTEMCELINKSIYTRNERRVLMQIIKNNKTCTLNERYLSLSKTIGIKPGAVKNVIQKLVAKGSILIIPSKLSPLWGYCNSPLYNLKAFPSLNRTIGY